MVVEPGVVGARAMAAVVVAGSVISTAVATAGARVPVGVRPRAWPPSAVTAVVITRVTRALTRVVGPAGPVTAATAVLDAPVLSRAVPAMAASRAAALASAGAGVAWVVLRRAAGSALPLAGPWRDEWGRLRRFGGRVPAAVVVDRHPGADRAGN